MGSYDTEDENRPFPLRCRGTPLGNGDHAGCPYGSGELRALMGIGRGFLDGDVFTLPKGIPISITEESDIVLLFAETDEDLEKRFPPMPRPS